MLPKKDSKDAIDKGILTLGTHVSIIIHELVGAYEDSVSVMAKSVTDSTNSNSSIDKKASNIKNQKSLYHFGFIKSVVGNNYRV